MKQIMAGIMLALLLLSMLPFAAAQEENQETTNAGATESTNTQDADTSALESGDSDKTRVDKRMRAQYVFKANNARERLEQAEEKYLGSRQRYLEARANFAEKRGEIRDLRLQLRDCTGDDCAKIKAEIRAGAPPFLQNAGEAMLTALRRLRERMEESNMEETDKQEALVDIDARIAAVQDAMTTLANLGEDAAKEEIKAAAQQLRQVWRETRPLLRSAAGRLVTSRYAGVIERAEHLKTKLERILERMEADGITVDTLEQLLADFSQKIDEAKAAHAESIELFNAGDEQGAHTKLKEAKQKLKEAHQILKELSRGIREARQAGRNTTNANTTA